jgi:hypothetical protein
MSESNPLRQRGRQRSSADWTDDANLVDVEFMEDVDRTDWDNAFSGMPHRGINLASDFDIGLSLGFGEIVSTTISEDPKQYADRIWKRSDSCPVCGKMTNESNRVSASLHPKFLTGLTIGVGVWIHISCLDACPRIDEPTPVPW